MARLFESRHWSHQSLCAVLVVLTIASPGVLRAQPAAPPVAPAAPQSDKALVADPAFKPAPLNLKYVLPGAAVVIAIRPAQVLKSSAAELMPTEVVQAALVKELGIDPLAADQVVVSVVPPGVTPPSYSVYAGFDEAVALKESQLTSHTQPTNRDGKPYWKSKEMMAPSIYLADDQTLLAAPEYALPGLIGGSTPAPGALGVRFAAAAHGDDFLAMVDVEPLRPLIQMAVAQGQADIPPQLRSVVEIPGLVKTLEVRFNISHPATSEAIVVANNDSDAERMVEIFESVKAFVADQALAQAKTALASEDPVEQASGRYSQRMTKYWSDQLQMVREGDRLVLFRTDPSTPAAQSQLMTVAVIGVLVALLLPAIQAAREAARRNSSLNNVKQIMLGLLNYESARGAFPTQAIRSADGKPLLSWRVQILPYIEQQALYKQFHLDEPWDSEHNKQLISQMPEIYLDPSSRLSPTDGLTSYLGVAGEGRLFDGGRAVGMKLSAIRDGTSNTIAVVQVDDADAVEWTRPEDWELEDSDPFAGLGGLHPGGVFVAGFCDGSVRTISVGLDPDVFKALLTVGGGERVNNF